MNAEEHLDSAQSFDLVADALTDLRDGRAVVVVDDEDRENEGDVVMAAQFVTPEAVNFMATEARGLICVPLPQQDVERLQIPMMVPPANPAGQTSPFTVSVEAARGVTTGISAHDRATTISVLADPGSSASDIVMPGHVFPLRAHPGGVRARRGHTEGSLELMRMAGLRPAAVICEIMDPDGSMARRASLREFARRHDLRIVAITDVADAVERPELEPGLPTARQDGSGRGRGLTEWAKLPTRFGLFDVASWVDGRRQEHLVLSLGNIANVTEPLVRIHSECLTGDAIGSVRCDCGDQLSTALAMIAAEGSGLLLYMRQEGRGIGLANKIRAYALQDSGLDTVDANVCLGFRPDERDYAAAVDILRFLGVHAVRLLTNNPAKIESLVLGGVAVRSRIPLAAAREENSGYMRTKVERLQHML